MTDIATGDPKPLVIPYKRARITGPFDAIVIGSGIGVLGIATMHQRFAARPAPH